MVQAIAAFVLLNGILDQQQSIIHKRNNGCGGNRSSIARKGLRINGFPVGAGGHAQFLQHCSFFPVVQGSGQQAGILF